MIGERAGRVAPPPRADRGGGTASAPPVPANDALNAPLFHSVIEGLENAGRVVVLDLGTARTETIALFGRFRCRLDIADLADGVDALNATEPNPKAMRTRVEALLPLRRREPTDLVLCWDVLNYLNRPAIAGLMESIANRGRHGMLVHCLMFYSAPQMPLRPGCWVSVDDSQIMNVAAPQSMRKAPRYTPEDLGQCMPRYSVERARLLRNGMQEYLFRL